MKILTMSALALALSLGLNLEATAKEYTVLLDESGSSPLFVSQQFKEAAITYLAERVSEMNDGDAIIIKTFGSLDVASNIKRHRLNISRHNKRKVARKLARLILNAGRSDKAQNSTNLHAWFGRNELDCEAGAELIALTDGIEASEYVSANKLLSGAQALPSVHENAVLKGCSIHFFGLGVGRTDREVTTLRNAWAAYFKSAEAQFYSTTL